MTKNPFAQPKQFWQAAFTLPSRAVAMAESSFDDIALSTSSFEAEPSGATWTVTLLFIEPADEAELQRRLMVISALYNITPPEIIHTIVAQQDWLSLVATQFPPMRIGRFFIHGSHEIEAPPVASLPIQIDAGAAFGSGEHATTRGCLEALSWLHRQHPIRHALDVGTGSGILAIGLAKLAHAQILATDIDTVAVRVTTENIAHNRVGQWVSALESVGYQHRMIKKHAPYQVIIANILARPLVSMAPDLAANIATGGFAILSGLLASQANLVLHAHHAAGLRLVKKIIIGDWCTLVLRRP